MKKVRGIQGMFFAVLLLLASVQSAYAAYQTPPIIKQLTDQLFRPIVNIMLLAATVIFIWGIIEYIAGASNETARTQGRQHILWGTIGLIIMVSVYFILSVISSLFYSS